MRIIITKSKYRASAHFWQAVENYNKNKYGLAGFDIPQHIFDSIHSLPKKMPLYKDLPESQKKIVRDIYEAFDNLWKKYQKDINRVLKKLKTTDFKRNWLKKEIPKTTGIEWPFKEIYIFPGTINWARVSENQLCVGIRPKHALKKDNLIPLLIHELIHINTWNIWEGKPKKQLSYKKDSIEIATVLLTNKIVQQMNTVFNMHLNNQEFATPFADLEKQFLPQFENILNQSKSYQDLIFNIDQFLKKIKHKPYYS